MDQSGLGLGSLSISCQGCPLGGAKCEYRGKIDSPYVILGEGPGIMEIKAKKPFVGPSGQLLDDGLPVGFVQDDALVLNAVRCLIAGGLKDPAKMLKAVNMCKPHVHEIIGRFPRRVILALGSWANISLTNNPDFKITKRRGELLKIPHPGRPNETTILAPILHPAYLLRGQGNLKQFRADIQAALDAGSETSTGLGSTYKKPDYKVLETAEDVRQLRLRLEEELEKDPNLYVASDIETSGFDYIDDYILCTGIYNPRLGDTGYIVKGDDLFEDVDNAYKTEVRLLYALRVRWLWHNGKFDIRFLRQNGIYARVDEDTLLLSYALDETQGGHDLESLAKDELKAPSYKAELKQWLPNKNSSYALLPKPILWAYQADDVKNTYGIFQNLRARVAKEAGLDRLYKEMLLPTVETLVRIEMRGIHVDPQFVQENEQQLLIELKALEDRLKEIAGGYVNPNSPQQVAELLYVRRGLRIKGRVPKGTDKKILVKLKGDAAVDCITKYRRVAKMLSTYIRPLTSEGGRVRKDGRVHTTYSNTTTTTGRLASKEPNVQNIPREARFRRMYRAKPGYILLEGDFNAAELRMLAIVSGDTFLTGVFLDDERNLHDEVSIAMYGKEFTQDQRIRAKAINFGIPYGREAFSIADEFNISVAEAQRLIDAWFARAPEAAAFISRCREAPLKGKTLVTVYGRRRRPGVVSAERLHEIQNEFANFFMQSTVGDICTEAANEIEQGNKLFDCGGALVNLVHDSLLAEILNDPACIEEAKRILKFHMEGVAKRRLVTPITLKVDFKQGTHWGLLK